MVIEVASDLKIFFDLAGKDPVDVVGGGCVGVYCGARSGGDRKVVRLVDGQRG